ncbi:hypothetical protein JCM8547_000198 [Rhodosporidiobolus lusitaniae]
MLTPPSFETARLSYRAVDKTADVALFNEMWSDPATQFGGMGSACAPWGPGKTGEFLKAVADAPLSIVGYLIKENPDDKEVPVGWMCLKTPYPGSPHRNAMLGVSMMPGQQGKGYGKEMLEFALEIGFLRMGLNRIECECFAWNEPAIRLYKQAGFVEEGRKRRSLFQEGEFRDELILGLLVEDWRASHEDKLQPNK